MLIAHAKIEAVIRRDSADRYSKMPTNKLKTGMHPPPDMSYMSNTIQATSIVITGVHTEITLRPIFMVNAVLL
jgi:hypothetical protein